MTKSARIAAGANPLPAPLQQLSDLWLKQKIRSGFDMLTSS